jgi:hypothetical protein
MASSVLQQQSVTLTRAQRDGVRQHVEHIIGCAATDLSPLSGHFDQESAQTALRHLTCGTRILEQLGWQERGDRDEYALQLDADVVAFMTELGQGGAEALEDALGFDPVMDYMIALDRGVIEAAAVVRAAVGDAA